MLRTPLSLHPIANALGQRIRALKDLTDTTQRVGSLRYAECVSYMGILDCIYLGIIEIRRECRSVELCQAWWPSFFTMGRAKGICISHAVRPHPPSCRTLQTWQLFLLDNLQFLLTMQSNGTTCHARLVQTPTPQPQAPNDNGWNDGSVVALIALLMMFMLPLVGWGLRRYARIFFGKNRILLALGTIDDA